MVFDNEINEVFDSKLSCFSDYNDIDDLYHELYDSLVKAKKYLKNKLVKNTLLHKKLKQLKKENHGFVGDQAKHT